MNVLVQLMLALFVLGIWALVLYFVVRAAVSSALDRISNAQGASVQVLTAQADLTARLTKHLMAQTDLMVAQARHSGMTDAQLQPILTQVAEQKASPAMALPFT
jgi:hypothetical protein